MANLCQKGGIYIVRFRFQGKEFKRSLKIDDRGEAAAACSLVEVTIHRLRTGQISIPAGVDPGDYIVSGGTLLPTPETILRPATEPLPSTRELSDRYAVNVKDLLAPSYHDSQRMHLRGLMSYLGDLADLPCNRVGFRDLDGYLNLPRDRISMPGSMPVITAPPTPRRASASLARDCLR